MYQNCIAVNVEGSGSDPISLSKMFVANIGNGCVTIEVSRFRAGVLLAGANKQI